MNHSIRSFFLTFLGLCLSASVALSVGLSLSPQSSASERLTVTAAETAGGEWTVSVAFPAVDCQGFDFTFAYDSSALQYTGISMKSVSNSLPSPIQSAAADAVKVVWMGPQSTSTAGENIRLELKFKDTGSVNRTEVSLKINGKRGFVNAVGEPVIDFTLGAVYQSVSLKLREDPPTDTGTVDPPPVTSTDTGTSEVPPTTTTNTGTVTQPPKPPVTSDTPSDPNTGSTRTETDTGSELPPPTTDPEEVPGADSDSDRNTEPTGNSDSSDSILEDPISTRPVSSVPVSTGNDQKPRSLSTETVILITVISTVGFCGILTLVGLLRRRADLPKEDKESR